MYSTVYLKHVLIYLISVVVVPGHFMDPVGEYYRTHDPLSFIGTDHSATVVAHSMYVPPSIFNLPQPPHLYQQVTHSNPSACAFGNLRRNCVCACVLCYGLGRNSWGWFWAQICGFYLRIQLDRVFSDRSCTLCVCVCEHPLSNEAAGKNNNF